MKTNLDEIQLIAEMKKQDPEKIRIECEKVNSKGGPIDPKIIDLVIGLNVWGIETYMSCEGHNEAKGFPWVMIYWKDLIKAARLLLEWNYRYHPYRHEKSVVWVIGTSWHPRIRPLSGPSLEIMQKDAKEFGEFLQKLPEDFNWTK
jgi:hypothetical protein